MRDIKLAKIKRAGVVGAGGAGFPTHVKLCSPAKTLIINGAECEPLLKVDQQLMEKKSDQLVKAVQTIQDIAGASEVVIALKEKNSTALAAVKEAIKGTSISLHILGDYYPAGDEHVAVFEITGRLIPQGGLPLNTDCITINVETLLNLAEALDDNPVTHSYLTIAGAVPRAATYKAPVGMPVKDILAWAGCNEMRFLSVIEGGPMMGKIVEDITKPITKTTKGLIVLPQDHPLIIKRTLPIERIIKKSATACIQCRYCTDLCPRYLLGHNLEPHKIMRSLKYWQVDSQVFNMALICTECGICEQFACIMDLSPRTINSILKKELSQKGMKPYPGSAHQKMHQMQAYRKIPSKRLLSRLGLTQYDIEAPLLEKEVSAKRVQIKLHQHIGVLAKPIVVLGQKIDKGELVAEIPDSCLGANIHSSISGLVTGISTNMVEITAAEVVGL